MKIVLLAPASNIHTRRWANGLAGRGLEVHVASVHDPMEGYSPDVVMHRLPWTGGPGYFLAAPTASRLVRQLQPDLVNAHYASGYGTLARLARCHPLLLSVWGSDVYDFPEISRLHRWWLEGNIASADAIASTSRAMAAQTLRWTRGARPISITPFGVDVERFQPGERRRGDEIVIGTIKTLLPKYGIDVLLRAFARLRDISDPAISARLRLEIAGEGAQRAELEALAAGLGISDAVRFVGRIPHESVPAMLRSFDVYVALSRLDSESFGVAILEAGACGIPVVVSDVGGLPEVVEDGRTGIVVPREDPEASARAIAELLADPSRCASIGEAGRRHVVEHYSWEGSLDLMLEAYRELVRTRPGGLREEPEGMER